MTEHCEYQYDSFAKALGLPEWADEDGRYVLTTVGRSERVRRRKQLAGRPHPVLCGERLGGLASDTRPYMAIANGESNRG